MEWGKPSKVRKSPGFIEPCIPTLAKAPPAGEGWLHEIKHDGYRVIISHYMIGLTCLTLRILAMPSIMLLRAFLFPQKVTSIVFLPVAITSAFGTKRETAFMRSAYLSGKSSTVSTRILVAFS